MFLFLLSDQVKLVNWPAGNVWLREVCRARVFQLASFTSTIGVVRKSTDSEPLATKKEKFSTHILVTSKTATAYLQPDNVTYHSD